MCCNGKSVAFDVEREFVLERRAAGSGPRHQVTQIRKRITRHYVFEWFADCRRCFDRQNAFSCTIERRDFALSIQRNDASRNVGQHCLHVPPPLV